MKKKQDKEMFEQKIAIIGGGNIGLALAEGLVNSGQYKPEQITITRRRVELIQTFQEKGFVVHSDNLKAVKNAQFIILAVRPRQVANLINDIKSALIPEKHVLISLVTGVKISELKKMIGKNIWITRAMPNIAISECESMTCISKTTIPDEVAKEINSLFGKVGEVINIGEEYMTPATALCACGIAFFLRAIRAASQGGIEIGFHSNEALLMAAQTAKGAAEILLNSNAHPESEIDKVTTPRGVTISGLNEMEHHGFSSAMIKGIVVSAKKAEKLLENNGK